MITIDVQKILRNVDRVRAMLKPGVKLCAVVKGDAYGCGDVRFSQVLEKSGKVDLLAVAMPDEGIHLRERGIRMPILILSDSDDTDVPQIVRHGLIPTIYRAAFARRLNAAADGTPVAAHVRADVCMGSPGIEPAKLPEMLKCLDALPNIRVEGLYTQLYAAYTGDADAVLEQLGRFNGIVSALDPALRTRLCIHAASTPAALHVPESHFDMVRVGAALYGLPVDEMPHPFEPVMTVRSHIVSIKTVEGEGYAGYARVRNGVRCTLATIMGGYEDALYLMFAKGGAMLVRGQYAPIFGEPSMDSTTIDITGIKDAAPGDEVVLLGAQGDREITIADIMEKSGFRMSNCQLVYKSGNRVKREYVNEPRGLGWMTLLGQVFDHAPAVRGALASRKKRSLREYIAELADYAPAPGIQPAGDIGSAIERHIAAYAGADAAREAASAAMQGLFTANHHGVDCFPQSVQGNHLYRALLKARGHDPKILPALACSGVPMDNSSYGRGLMAFDTLDGQYPLRIPLLPSRKGSCVVGLYPAIEAETVRGTLERLRAGRCADRLSERMQRAVGEALTLYLDPRATATGRYTDQAEFVNLRLTERALGRGVAYISLEKIATELLLADLADPDSLYCRLLFDPPVWRAVLEELSGAVGCWNLSAWRGGEPARAGTALFWGRRENHQRYPLTYEDGWLTPHGPDARAFAFTPDALAEALQAGHLYPSLFSVFAPIVFARGMRVFGGCFQPEYLRAMREGIARALRGQGRPALAERVAQCDVSGYLSGPLFLTNPDSPAPLGMLELYAAPPGSAALNAALDMPLWEAHRHGLSYLYADAVPADERQGNWREVLRGM